MRPTFSDEGLVLRRRAYGDADRILVILTREHGKLGVIARGARRGKAKNASGLDLLTRSQLLLIEGRGLFQLAQAKPLGRPWPLDDLMRTARGAVLAELADAMVEERHPDEVGYTLVCSAREALADQASDSQVELCIAVFQLAEHAGYLPELHSCVGCGQPLENRDGGFLPQLGGVLQGDCLATQAASIPCSSLTLRVMRRLAAGDQETVRRLRGQTALWAELQSCLLAHLEHHVDRRLRTAQVLAEL